MYATYNLLVPFTLELSHELSAFSNGRNLYLRVISKAISNTNENETETRTGIHISFEHGSSGLESCPRQDTPGSLHVEFSR